MYRNMYLLSLMLLFGLVGSVSAGLGAHYCKLNSGQAWESAFRAGAYADVVVRFDNSDHKFVFWRASSYLPHWQTPSGTWYLQEVLPRSGDGTAAMPDKFCQYSKVRIIEDTPARVVVHWRYAPNFANVDHDAHVDEYYTIYPDGVCIRTIRHPAARLDDWLNPANVTIQNLRLLPDGISTLPASWQSTPDLVLSGQSAGKYDNHRFDNTKRCYVLKSRKNGSPSILAFTLDTSGGKFIHNPAIIIKNWGDARASVNVHGTAISGYKTGYAHHAESTDLILWLSVESAGSINVSVSPRGGSSRTNKAPAVDAGKDQSILVSAGSSGHYVINLDGVVEDDGLPNDSLTATWSKLSGPGSAGFDNPDTPDTNVSLSTDGAYQLRLTANDGSRAGSDDIIIVVKKDPGVAASPAAWWKFDEAAGDTTLETISGISDYIAGSKSVWAAGVSGSALVFDGYPSMVTHPQEYAPAISSGFTLEAWIAVKAYPWNWCPIIHQSRWQNSGYYLGIDAFGHLGLKASIGGNWESVTSSAVIELNRWVHVAGTFDSSTGEMRVYIDGSEKGSTSVSNSNVSLANEDIRIGKGIDMPPTDPIRKDFACSYSFDGIIDEVKIYDHALTSSEVLTAYNNNKPGTLAANNPPVQKPILPAGPVEADRFGAFYTKLKFHETWDNLWRVSAHPDIVVEFDETPYKFVFWRGTCYIPHWVSENNIWYNNQFNEARSSNGCAEPMSDTDCRHSHVRIIQSHDARAIVHWRYALENVVREMVFRDGQTGWTDWTDEYFYIYPDGVAVRKINLWSTEPTAHHEWHEVIVLTNAGTWPVDVLEHQALYVAHNDGSSRGYSWYDPDNHDDIENNDGNIFLTNLRAQYDPFAIVAPDDAGNDGAGGWGSGRHYPYYNHWPIAQIPSDGRYCFSNERTAHTSLTHIEWPFYELTSNSGVKIMLTGMTDKPAGELAPLAKSWDAPAQLSIATSGFSGGSYDKAQRAYLISRTSPEATRLEFTIQGSSNSPIVNPCFIVENWGRSKAALSIDGQNIDPGPHFRQGIETNVDEVSSLVVWIEKQSTSPINIKISESSDLPGDYNGDGVINFLDFAVFIHDAEWLAKP